MPARGKRQAKAKEEPKVNTFFQKISQDLKDNNKRYQKQTSIKVEKIIIK